MIPRLPLSERRLLRDVNDLESGLTIRFTPRDLTVLADLCARGLLVLDIDRGIPRGYRLSPEGIIRFAHRKGS